jgi:hypothetical protein
MASTHKKVIVRKLDRDSVQGYVAPTSFIADGKIELLNIAGKLVTLDLTQVKGIYFVREFSDSESIARKIFAARPRTEGLWVRLTFTDGEVVEGMMPNDLAHFSAEGFFINPPDTRSNTQRIFVPKTSLQSLLVLSVIGGAKAKRTRPAASEAQVPMFTE